MGSYMLLMAGIIHGYGAILLKKFISNKFHSTTYSTVLYLTYALFSIPLLFVNFHIPFSFLPWILVVFSVVIFALSTVFNFKAFKVTDVSTISIVSKTSIIFSAFLGIIFLKEKYTTSSYLGLFLIFIGAVVLSYEGKRFKIEQGIFFILIQSLLNAFAGFLDKVILKSFSPFSYVFINSLLVGSVFLFRTHTRREIGFVIKKQYVPLIGISIINVLAWAIYLYVLQTTDISRTYPIYKSLSLIVPVVLGIFLLKETNKLWQKIVGSFIGILGIILLY